MHICFFESTPISKVKEINARRHISCQVGESCKYGKEYNQESSELVTQCKLSYTMIDSREKAMQEERLEQRTDVVIKSNTILCPGDYKDLLKV